MIRMDALRMTGKCDLRCLFANMRSGTAKSPISAQKTMLSHRVEHQRKFSADDQIAETQHEEK